MGKHMNELDARARAALADARRRAVLEPMVRTPRGRDFATAMAQFADRVSATDGDAFTRFFDWPETKSLMALLDERQEEVAELNKLLEETGR